ncbi:sulfatase [Ningiella sp. W23]|uniref:sulfatase n=1 Tax=Ningiella sp. W23 TaxID=3023715 RepID=UPI003757B253
MNSLLLSWTLFRGTAIYAVVCLFALCLSLQTNAVANDSDNKTNVLFIAIDDMRPSTGSYGDKLAVTPNLDEIASKSVQFNRAYVQMATCSPSRASLMSSQRPDTLQIYYSNPKTRRVEDSIPSKLTLNGYFKHEGYETVGIGKIYHAPDDSSQGWSTQWDNKGNELTRGLLSANAYLDMLAWDETHPNTKRAVAYEAADVGDDAYPDGQNTRFAMLELNRLAKEKTPFLMMMGYKKPHLPFACPKAHWDKYDSDRIALPVVSTPPKNSPPYALNNSGELRVYPYMPKGKKAFSEQDTLNLKHGYYACISYIDTLIGNLLQELEETGLSDNTMVVIWGDHGFKVGEYGRFNKHTNYEIDTRVPLWIKMPGQTVGQTNEAIVETIDIFPTILDVLGMEVPDSFAGKSFKSVVIGERSNFKNAAFQQFHRTYKKQPVMGYSIRTANYRYVAWLHRITGELLAQELYDHTKDPLETINVVGDIEYKTVVAKHKSLLIEGYPPTLGVK